MWQAGQGDSNYKHIKVKLLILPITRVLYRLKTRADRGYQKDLEVLTEHLKKAECQRIDAFELWCWRRLLRGPWTERRSNQSILKEINSEYSLEGLMLKLKFQYFVHLMRRVDDSLERAQCWERLKAGGGDDLG